MTTPPGRTMPAPRRLLARLREQMAGDGSAQDRLNHVVELLALEMVAEVCSVYILRAGEVLELFATEGLKPEAVHRTRLRVGEGLVGSVAASGRALNLADAQSHPQFAYRPETGEEIFKSLLGVPVLRAGRVLGVIVVQNKTQRHYTDEEVETLQTVAMVLAELVAGGELVQKGETAPADGIGLLPLRIEGVTLNAGVGIGDAVLHQPRIQIRQVVSDDPNQEHDRLRIALADMHGALDAMLKASESMDDEHRDILETYRMFAEDAGWLNKIREAIDSGLTAEAAVQKVHDDTVARMSQIQDPYIRERLNDMEDLANRLLQYLVNGDADKAGKVLPENMVVVAKNMGPAELLDYDTDCIRALVLEEGTATSHVAIMARALDIPVLGRVRGILTRIDEGDPLIVDAANAQLFVRPAEDIQMGFAEAEAMRAEQKRRWQGLVGLPAETRDGVRVSMKINAGLLVDVKNMLSSGADGVGLYRTEIPFMARESIPGVAEQVQLYTRILEQAEGKPVVFRTLDAGGDKVLPYWSNSEEENPAMGWRAIRVTLDRPFLLRQQLRALITAAGATESDLHVMFPMIAEVAEFEEANKLLDLELQRQQDKGQPLPRSLHVGAMLEVPSLMFQMESLLKKIDFLSVGSNDLFQFLFATDRGNPKLSGRYDPLSPPIMGALGTVVRKTRDSNVKLSLCGEMGGRPIEAMALLGLGFRTLSMNASSIGPVKNMIRSLHLRQLEDYMVQLREVSRHSMRSHLQAFARDHGIEI